jgi:hypothetical protein
MGRIYYAPFDDIQVTTDADQDVWELGAVTNKVILHGFELSSEAIAAESVDLRLVRRSTSGNGTAVVEVQRATDDAAPLAVVEELALVPGAIGDILMGWKWEQLGPLVFLPTPEMRPVLDAGAYFCLNIQSALAATTGWSGWVCWEEL